MILHARFEGVHAALAHSPCLTRSLMLDEKLAQSSPCIIIITFSITLYRWLFFYKFSSLFRSDHVENNSFHVWHMKLSFHQVFIHPQRTPIEWVMPVLLRRCNLSKADFRLHIVQCFCHISLYGSSNLSILVALEPALDGASYFQHFLPWTCLTRSSKLMKTATSVFEVRWRWCIGLQFLWVWFSHLNLCLIPRMVSETWDFSHNLLF
jgi:hypothetical protein